MNALLGRKLGMSRLFDAKGAAIAVSCSKPALMS